MNKLIITLLMCLPFSLLANHRQGKKDREIWVQTLTRIADPVLENLSQGTLKSNMEVDFTGKTRKQFAYLEAFGRLFCGMAPWLELGPDQTKEGKLREKYIQLTLRSFSHAVDSTSADYMLFGKPYQPLVDAAFLSQGLLRAKTQIWERLDSQTQQNLITELKRTRRIKPWESNWLLFASMIEATLLDLTGECDMSRLTYGISRFRNDWYKGDGHYGDGPRFHFDYYNSFVIHPILTDVLAVMKKHNIEGADFYETQIKRHSRFAEQLERMISPEGTYPVIGRSIAYRFGAFHALSQASLLNIMPADITPAQVRSAMTQVIRRQMKDKNTFDKQGWLRIGFSGYQPELGEEYVNTGSLYLCAMGLLQLGLSPEDPFWSDAPAKWSSLKAWSGDKSDIDKAIGN